MALRKKFVLPPPPNPDQDINDYSWRDWFRQLRDYVVDKGSILWSQIDFTGSNITDIITRRHNDLQTIQGGATNQYYHLNSAEYTGTGTGVFVRKDNPTVTSPNIDHIDLDITTGSPAYQQGRVFYDNVDKALAYYNDVNGVTVNVGQEELTRVYNNTGSTISNGAVCYLNGAFGAFPTVALAKADSTTTSSTTLGLATHDIPTGTYGYICTSGLVHDVNTNAYTAGQTLYLSAATAGAFTSVAPLQPNYSIIVGYVTKVDVSAGVVFVHIDKQPWFPNLEVRDTSASLTLPTTPTVFKPTTAVTQQGLTYDSSTGVISINTTGSYAITILFNAEPSASNKKIYFYVEENTGSGWVIGRYTARELQLQNATQTQLTISAARWWSFNTQIRFYVWGDATVYLKTADLPGTTPGTVTLPAYRCLMAG